MEIIKLKTSITEIQNSVNEPTAEGRSQNNQYMRKQNRGQCGGTASRAAASSAGIPKYICSRFNCSASLVTHWGKWWKLAQLRGPMSFTSENPVDFDLRQPWLLSPWVE